MNVLQYFKSRPEEGLKCPHCETLAPYKQEKQKGLYLKSTLDIARQKELFGDQI